MIKSIIVCLMVLSGMVVCHTSFAAENDEEFFQSVEGSWSGAGNIVAGKYKGTKFTCKLIGSTPGFVAGMKLDGSCNVGMFSQSVSASVVQMGGTYQGEFNNGSRAEGLDIISGEVIGRTVVLDLNRKQLDGVMTAAVDENSNMNVMISVKVGEELIPVIDMSLKRVVDKNQNRVARNNAEAFR
jgi:hypothetical protein